MANKLDLGKLLELGLSRADIASLRITQQRVGIADNVPTAADNAKQFEEYPLSNPDAIEALRSVDELRNAQDRDQGPLIAELVRAVDELRNTQEPPQMAQLRELPGAVDELRNELASTRSDVQALRAVIDDLLSAAAVLPQLDQFRSRIESLEDRLA